MSENGLSPETIREIEGYILERLPAVLEQDPNFARWIEGLLAEKFPKRDELARMLDAIEAQRRESREQLTQIDERGKRVEEHVERLDERGKRVEEHVERLDEHVEHIEQRVEHIEQRVERIEGHVEPLDGRIKRVEEHVERLDERVGHVEHDLAEHRVETRQEFGKVNERFEQVDRRFDQVDQRFDQVDERADNLEAKMDAGFDELRNDIWETHRAIDRLGARWGIRNERVFRQTVRELLQGSFNAQVEERHIQGEQFDCIITNGHHILVEIAASVGPKIIERLERKRQLYIDETGVVPHRFLLAVGSIHSRRAEQVRAAGFELIEPELDEE